MNNIVKRNKFIKSVILICVVSVVLALVVAFFFTAHLWDLANIRTNLVNLRLWTTLNRAYILFFVFVFVGIHFIVPVRRLYEWMFRYRWILGIAVLLFLTVNRYHGDSLGYYATMIQPNNCVESANPIFGETRGIRSDEFVVTTPSILASVKGSSIFDKYNSIMRGTETLNITNGIYVNYATLGYTPQEVVYAVLPVEYAFSFCWWFPLIFGFLLNLELFLIISKGKKLLATAGASLVIFSSFYLWWGFSMHLLAGPGTIVCVYFFLQTEQRWKKILLAIGMALSFSIFVTNLYPAWQVPLGYVFLAIGVWVLVTNWNKVKSIQKKDWLIIIGALLLFVSLVLAYMASIQEYMQAITQTAYPGERVDTGGFGINKLFYYAQAPFYAYKDIGNPCEAGVYFSLFPIPSIVAGYCWMKEKKKDLLTGLLLLIQIPMLFYVTTGLPEIIAKILLYSNSTVIRVIDVIGLIQIIFIIILFSRYENSEKMTWWLSGVLGCVTAIISIVVCNQAFPNYLGIVQMIFMFVLIVVFCMGMQLKLNEVWKKVILIGFIGVSIYTGIAVRPVMKGFDAIYSKPIASEIQEICENEPEARWITYGGGLVLSGYSVACGASTINSVNTYPNIELWKQLDPEGQYEEIYNRYAHVNVELTHDDTSFELIHLDHIQLNLSYEDIEEIGVDYILAMGELHLEDNPYVQFERVYEEDGMSIYQIIY